MNENLIQRMERAYKTYVDVYEQAPETVILSAREFRTYANLTNSMSNLPWKYKESKLRWEESAKDGQVTFRNYGDPDLIVDL